MVFQSLRSAQEISWWLRHGGRDLGTYEICAYLGVFVSLAFEKNIGRWSFYKFGVYCVVLTEKNILLYFWWAALPTGFLDVYFLKKFILKI